MTDQMDDTVPETLQQAAAVAATRQQQVPAEDETTAEAAAPFIGHKLLTSSLAVYPPLPLSNGSMAESDAGSLFQVVVSRGRWLEHAAGHRAPGGRTYLYAEEAVWSMESGALEVVHQGVPLSVEEAFAILLDNEAPHSLAYPSPAYAVYNSLRNNGFIVMRPRQYAAVHVRARSAVAAAQTAATASSAAATASAAAAAAASCTAVAARAASPYYSVRDYTAPQAKKIPRRMQAHMPPPPPSEQLQQERDRLREMQAWLPSFDEDGGIMPAAPAIADAGAPSAPAIPVSPLPSDLLSLLSQPCDAWCVWLPAGGGGGSGGESSSFRKTAPPLPDFVCLVANPALPFERLWSARPHCSRAAIAEAQKHHEAQSSHLRSSERRYTLADVLALMNEMTDEMDDLAAVSASATPAADSAPAAASPVMPLRLAHLPSHQQRVFFVDWPVLQPPPSCIDPPPAVAIPAGASAQQQAVYAQAFKQAAGMSVFG